MELLSTLSFSPELLTVFESAVSSTAEGITISDASKHDVPLIFVNRGFSDITGYQPLEALGRNCRFLQGPRTDPQAIEMLRKGVETGQTCVSQLLNYRKDGTVFWNRVSLIPVRNLEEEITHFVGIQCDVSDSVLVDAQEKQMQAMQATVNTVNNLVLNYLCNLKYYRLRMEQHGMEESLLEDFDSNLEEVIEKLRALEEIKDYREITLAPNLSGIDTKIDS